MTNSIMTPADEDPHKKFEFGKLYESDRLVVLCTKTAPLDKYGRAEFLGTVVHVKYSFDPHGSVSSVTSPVGSHDRFYGVYFRPFFGKITLSEKRHEDDSQTVETTS
jgi:hypothetical protein